MPERLTVRSQLDFSLLPKTTALFRDYVNDFQRVAEFYPADPRRLREGLDPARVLADRDFSRQRLTEILEDQNRDLGCGSRTLDNIELLKQPDTLVVITGQQVGLFTGPLFTIYKALTVVQVARQLSQRHTFRFLPLFWMASDDHDYDEVNGVTLLDQSNRLITLRHRGDQPSGLPVGTLRLGPEIESLLTHLDQALPESEFKAGAMELLRAAYRPRATFSEAFGRAMLSLFAKDGLILVDPAHPGLKRLAVPVFRRELESAPRSAELVALRGDQLVKREYHAQIKPNPQAVNLFLLMDGARAALLRKGDGFGLRKAQGTFSADELIGFLEGSPERFSPNVVLRPVVQDHLFPVAAYVAGPAEIAYFAQLGEVYGLFGLPMPAIYPRVSITFLESRVWQLLEKFGLEVEEVFVEEDRLIGQVQGNRIPGDLEELFDTSRQKIRDTFQALSEEVLAFEPTLEGYLDSAAGKMDRQLSAVRRKLLQARRARDDQQRGQVSKVSRHLFPAGRLQERVLNIFSFLSRHGPKMIDELGRISPEPWKHMAVEIGR